METIKEIEMKLFVGQSVEHIHELAKKNNWQQGAEEWQEDIYYTSAFRDFIVTEECLRIRETNNYCELTWKPPTTEKMLSERQFWKQEIDLNITSQKEIAKELLMRLDFIEYVTVKKRRLNFFIDKITNFSLDHIDTLGWFIEIETLSSDEESGVIKNAEIAALFGLDPESVINVPYRDLVKAGRVYRH